ncbi:hypothetical protein [Algibacter sp. Ld11]|uniref:hypothetical protein n=1 Tax=Algibacter sp. Ld11 TaxID=649150 RepID=UPI0038664B21
MKKKKKVKISEFFNSLLVGLISGVVVVLLQQFFASKNYDYELKNNLVKENYQYYVALQNFVDIESYSIQIQPKKIIDTVVISNRVTLRHSFSKEMDSLKLALIAVDTIKQKEWMKEKEQIILNKNKVSPELFYLFEEIIKIQKEHPWNEKLKTKNGLYNKKHTWSNENFINKWFEANRKLWEYCNYYTKSKYHIPQ